MTVASFIASQRADFAVPHVLSCRALSVSESWFYKWRDRPPTARQVRRARIDEAVKKKAPLVEIVPGKGSGQLKKRVLRFLDQKEIKARYHRVEKDSHNFGRIFVHFRPK